MANAITVFPLSYIQNYKYIYIYIYLISLSQPPVSILVLFSSTVFCQIISTSLVDKILKVLKSASRGSIQVSIQVKREGEVLCY